MGVDIHFVTKSRDKSRQENSGHNVYEFFNRSFRNFAAAANGELYQMEKVLELDLRPITKWVNLEPPGGYMLSELYEAEQEADHKRVAEIKQAIEKFENDWEANYENDFDGWLKIEPFAKLLRKVAAKLEIVDWQNHLEFNIDSDSYFSSSPAEKPYDDRFHEDIKRLLILLEKAKEFGETHVGFWIF